MKNGPGFFKNVLKTLANVFFRAFMENSAIARCRTRLGACESREYLQKHRINKMTFHDGWPPFYDERPSEAIVETSQLYLAYSAAAILVGLLLVLPGVHGREVMYLLVVVWW